jgi:hypothetical protein
VVYTDGTWLVADTERELHDFAKRVGLRYHWYIPHHRYPRYPISGKPLKEALKEKDCIHIDTPMCLQYASEMILMEPILPPGAIGWK